MAKGVITTLLLLILVNKGKALITSTEQLTWTEALNFCRNRNSSLIPGTRADFPTPHWTGYHHRLSDWIHVLGCYDDQEIRDLGVPPTHTLDRGSVGLCQERCGHRSFALQDTTCMCLRDFPSKEGVSPSRCDRNCSADDDGHVNDCGGSGTFNVYRVTPSEILESGITVNCMVLGCYEQWSQIHTDNCTEDLGRICQSEASTNKSLAPDEKNFKSWSETYVECRDRGSYLYGNISLEENSGTLCGRLYDIRSNTPETWLGVARQVFLTTDRGEDSFGKVLDCSVCFEQSAGCLYVADCNSISQKATAVCGTADHLLVPMPTSTTPENPSQTPAPKTGNDDDSDRTVAIVVPVVIVVLLLAGIGIYVIKRRREKSDIPEGKTAKTYHSNIVYESSQTTGPPKSFTVTEKPENTGKSRISETKDKHIYHEIESNEDKIAVSGPADQLSPSVDSKEVDVLQENGARTQPTVNEKPESASEKSQSGTDITKGSELNAREDKKQSTVSVPITTPEGGDIPEVTQHTNNATVVNDDDKHKTDSNLIYEPDTKKMEDTSKPTENINMYDNKTESKSTPSFAQGPGAERPVNRKNVSVIQVCKF